MLNAFQRHRACRNAPGEKCKYVFLWSFVYNLGAQTLLILAQHSVTCEDAAMLSHQPR